MMSNERLVGTVSRGIRCPIIRTGDDLASIVTDSVLAAAESEGFALRDRDVISVTESIVARAQGNYATIQNIADDVKAKLGGGTVGVIFPILSRNRFAICLRGIAMGCKKIVLMLSYPSDEVGNELVSLDKIDEAGVNPYSDVDTVLTCDIHTRKRTKRILKDAGAKIVLGLDDIMNAPVDGSGYNENYGLLGSNKSTEDTVKLFPQNAQPLVEDIQKKVKDATGKNVNVYDMALTQSIPLIIKTCITD